MVSDGNQSSVPNTLQSSEGSQSSNQAKKLVEVDSDYRIKGPNAPQWSYRAGYFIRTCIPINYETWKKVDVTFKNDVWNALMEEFKFEVPANLVRDKAELEFPEKWRTFKVKLRNHMRQFDSMEAAIAGCPKGIDKNHWKDFVERESKPEVQERCKKNAQNKRKSTYNHHLGRQTYAQKCYRLDIANPEKKHTRVDCWISGVESSDGSVSDDIRERYELVKEANERIVAKCTDEGITVTEIPIDEDALSEVFGKEKKSRTRGFSNHISKKQLGRTTISKIYTEQARASHRELTNGMDQMKDMMTVMMQKMKNMEDSFNTQPRANFHTPSTEVDSNGVDRTGATRRNLVNLFETSNMHPPRVSPTEATSFQVNKNPRVILLSRNGEPVAKGYVPTDLRGGTCHSKKILPCESRVYVTEVIDGMAPIHAAPQDENTIMQDVTEGGFLIWLNDLLKYI